VITPVDINGRDLLRTVKAQGLSRIVFGVERETRQRLLAAVELGVRAVTRRAEAPRRTGGAGPQGVHRGRGAPAGPARGRLLTQVSRLQRHVLEPKG